MRDTARELCPAVLAALPSVEVSSWADMAPSHLAAAGAHLHLRNWASLHLQCYVRS